MPSGRPGRRCARCCILQLSGATVATLQASHRAKAAWRSPAALLRCRADGSSP
jgi:hypothetical protein